MRAVSQALMKKNNRLEGENNHLGTTKPKQIQRPFLLHVVFDSVAPVVSEKGQRDHTMTCVQNSLSWGRFVSITI